MTTDANPRLLGDDLIRMLKLVSEADSVEMKLTVPDHYVPFDRRSARPESARGADPSGVLPRHADLALYQAGVVARARRVQRRVGDSVVKLRPVVPTDIDQSLRASA